MEIGCGRYQVTDGCICVYEGLIWREGNCFGLLKRMSVVESVVHDWDVCSQQKHFLVFAFVVDSCNQQYVFVQRTVFIFV